jgi:hypothetical protein
LEFVKFFLKDYLTSDIPDFHKYLYTNIPKEPRMALATPRGHGKSTIVSVFYPLWLALFEKRKDICIISASETLAVEWLRKIKRELDSNPKIHSFFGDLKSDKWTESHIVLSNASHVNIRARGAGGQIRGFRPDVIICDDIETDESVESEEQRKKLKDWLFKACLNTLLPEGQFLLVGTIIHPLSVLNDLLSIDNGWCKKKYQAYNAGIQEPGNELWPQLWNHQRLQERKREIGSWAFASEYMNNPVSDETAPVKENMIRYWTELPTQLSVVIAVDPAYSEDDSADYKVYSVIGIDQNQNRYLVSYLRTHIALGEFEDAIINGYLQYKHILTGLGIPNSGVEKGFYASFMRKCEYRKIYPPVYELKNTFTNSTTMVTSRNKKARTIAALQPLFEAGKYFIHANHIEAREELLTIGSSRWDDVVDTMAYAEQILQPVFFEEKKSGDDHQDFNNEPARMLNYGWEY